MNKLYLVVEDFISTTEILRRCLGNIIKINENNYEVHVVLTTDFSFLLKNISKKDLLLFSRVDSPHLFEPLCRIVKSGQPYACILDDNFWMLLGSTELDRYYQNPLVRRTLELSLFGASVVFCYSKAASFFYQQFNENVVILPTYFDFSLLKNSQRKYFTEEIRIGVVGNSSRAADIEIISPAIKAILDEGPKNVFFEFFGFTPDSLKQYDRVRSFSNISNYEHFLQEKFSRNWLLGLAPLHDTRFSKYKTNNKFREFGACGIATIFSDVEIYRDGGVIDGKTGWLLKNQAKDWEKLIRNCIENPSDTYRVGLEAQKVVHSEYSLEFVRSFWVDSLSSLTAEYTLRKKITLKVFLFLGRILDLNFQLPKIVNSDTNKRKYLHILFKNAFFKYRDRCEIFNLRPGEAIRTNVKAFDIGDYVWSLIIATNYLEPRGLLSLKVFQTQNNISNFHFQDEHLKDGAKLTFRFNALAIKTVTIEVLNNTDSDVGLYNLSWIGSSQYISSRAKYHGRFVV